MFSGLEEVAEVGRDLRSKPRCCPLGSRIPTFLPGLQAVHATVDSSMRPAIQLDVSGRLCGRGVSRRKLLLSVQCR